MCSDLTRADGVLFPCIFSKNIHLTRWAGGLICSNKVHEPSIVRTHTPHSLHPPLNWPLACYIRDKKWLRKGKKASKSSHSLAKVQVIILDTISTESFDGSECFCCESHKGFVQHTFTQSQHKPQILRSPPPTQRKKKSHKAQTRHSRHRSTSHDALQV